MILSFFLLVRPPRSRRLLIMVWCSSKTEHRRRLPLDSGPIFRLAIFTVRRWSLVPPSFYPSPESPGFPVPCSSPVSSLSCTSSPSVSFSPPPPPSFPPQQRLKIPRRPFSGVLLRWTQQIKTARSRGGSGAPRSWCHRPMRLAVLGFGVGFGGGVEDGAPRNIP